MNRSLWKSVPSALLASALALAPATLAAAQPAGYAEEVYAEYSAASGDVVLFEIETLEQGKLSRYGKARLGDLLTVPSHRIDAEEQGVEIRQLRLMEGVSEGFASHDLGLRVSGFEEAGYPVSEGVYRKLQVGVALGDQVLTHESLELCWAAQGHCVLVDPAVIFIDSIVKNRKRLQGEGWGLRIHQQSAANRASCGLASDPGAIGRSLTWPAYWREYHNAYGHTLVRKDLGGQQSAIRCNSSCQPDPYGYSHTSSCWGTAGWQCACDNKFGFGTTGSTGKWIAETRCTHKWYNEAQASGEITNYGSASVDIAWTLGGGVDANGGQSIETCGYY